MKELRPLLVIVNGPPAAGKTTIADTLARELALPCYGKDLFKDILFDTLGSSDREWSIQVGAASVRILMEIAATELRARRSFVLENAFVPKFDLPRLQRLRKHFSFDVAQVWCHAPANLLFDRFHARSTAGGRHPGHVDDRMTFEQFERLVIERGYAPLPLGGTLIEIDTTDFNAVDVIAVIRQLRPLVSRR